MNLPPEVRIVEVGPRDGLQNEAAPVPTGIKVGFIERLAAAGLPEIEVTSFVHPARIPQLADAEAVIAALGPRAVPRFSALVPNERGLARALETGIARIAVFTAASDTFAERNIGMNVRASLERFAPLVRQAREAGLTVRGYVSTCWECPYEGPVPGETVERVAASLLELGVDEVSLGDTVGTAVPTDVIRLLEALRPNLPPERLALHFHDTSGTALANALSALELGFTTFDSSAGGLGGCPYAPGAAGNLATEDLVSMLERMGIRTGVSLAGVAEASAFLEPHLGHPLPGRQYQRLKAKIA